MAKKTISISVGGKLNILDLYGVDSEIDQLRIVRGELACRNRRS